MRRVIPNIAGWNLQSSIAMAFDNFVQKRFKKWVGMDSNHRCFTVADLQSAALGQLGDLPI